jgi:hypothetical protein
VIVQAERRSEERPHTVGRMPINQRLRQEFFEAVREYVRWAFGHPKQPLPFNRYVQLSLVCGRVADSTDLLSQDAFDTLMTLAIEDAQRKEELRVDRTHVTAARILMELIDAKRQGPDWSPHVMHDSDAPPLSPGSSPADSTSPHGLR